MKAYDLKASILQLAVSGKLVAQDPNDEPVSVLLKRIKKEREQLIKEGKIKKGKPLAEISEDEIPFEIPASWEWVRLGNVTHNFGQKIPDTEFTYIDVKSVDNKKGCLGTDVQIILPKDAPSRARKIVKKGTVIYSTVRPYLLNICIIEREPEKEFIASTAFCVLNPISVLLNTYLYYCLRSPVFTEYVSNEMMGMAYPAISDKELLAGLIPLPPLTEQHRIVARIEELMPLVEAYDREEQKLTALEAKFPDALRQSILQYAVEGKLVPQKAEDGTAAELLVKIRKERDALVKEGKIKKGKPLSPVSEEEKPFEIPDSWEWVRLGDIFVISTGKTPLSTEKSYYEFGNIPWVISTYTSNDTISIVDSFITEYAVEQTGLKLYPPGTLIYAMYGQGKTRGQISELLIDATINQASAALEEIYPSEILRKYVKIFCKYNYYNIRTFSEGTSQPNLNMGKVSRIAVPLPPLAEQQRIVERVEELMGLCDRIPIHGK